MWISKRVLGFSFSFLLLALFLPVFIACSSEGENSSSAAVVIDDADEDNYPNGPYPDDYYNKTVDYGELVDSRDGQKYRTITVERQTWMAENLSFKSSFGKTKCPFPELNKCGNYGVLYTWAVAVDSAKNSCGFGVYCTEKLPLKGICPDGWHLPSKAEWDIFDDAVEKVMLLDSSKTDSVGYVLKSSEYWFFDASGDKLGFGGLPIVKGVLTYYWSSSEIGHLNSYVSDLNWSGSSFNSWTQYGKSRYGSVRCTKDSELADSLGGVSGVVKGNTPKVLPCRVNGVDACKYGKLTDSRDGRTYKTVQIGTQNWMAEALNYKIPTGGTYESDDANYKFFRYYSMFSAREACPSGWHLPDSLEWRTLINAVGGDSVASVVLKSDTGWTEAGTWDSRGLNSYGFNVLDLGSKYSSDFTEDSLLERGSSQYKSSYWSADVFPEGKPPELIIWALFEKIDMSHGYYQKYNLIRCLEGNPPRDTTIRTWYGHRGDTTIVTGLKSETNAMNLWYSYTDEVENGKTHIEWPVDTSKKYSVFLPSLIHKCQGICGTVDFDKGSSSEDPYAGVGLYVVGETTANSGIPAAGDASNWGGLCIAYASDLNAYVRVQLGDSLDGYLEYPLESTSINSKKIEWSDFNLVLNNATKNVSLEEAVKHVVSVNFHLKGITGSSANFTVYSIGGYRGNCADIDYFF